MKYYIIAGEASGDLHASNLMKALRTEDPDAGFRCWGGDLMEKAGGRIVRHYRDLAFMGFVEVVLNLRTILRNFRFCEEDLLSYKPDALILVDYPGFNLRMAKFASRHGIRVFYYISPKVWAWHSSRVRTIRRHVDRMFVILPFEREFYRKYGMEVDFTGHPLCDAIENTSDTSASFRRDLGLDLRPVIALLPGSRKQEVEHMLEVMLAMVPVFPDHQFVIGAVGSLPKELYGRIIANRDVTIVTDRTYDLLRIAHSALVTSGTATLEAALFTVPQVVCYKANPLSYRIARMVVRVRFISLVNLIMGRESVSELIQSRFNTENLKTELSHILAGERRDRMIAEYGELIQMLGGSGASARTASLMAQYLRG